jgi:glycosyltransferase involved in cell wall biosynthesis
VKFSICIPNFNYERYLGSTIQSVLDQDYADSEILVSDNASTDGSVAVVKSFNDPRIRLNVNPYNMGFAPNLDCAGRMATGDRLILLSSDDLMEPRALSTYRRLLDLLPDRGSRAIISSAEYQIDSAGNRTHNLRLPGPPYLLPEDRVPQLEAQMGAAVYRVAAGELLRRCVLGMRNPFHFATTTYPRELYDAVAGYGGGRLFNPDKWFHWRLLTVADEAYFIDLPLFAYRWHASNQLALQKRAGALKFLVDEYLTTIELSDAQLSKIGLARDDLEAAFVEHVIGRHGLATLAKTNASEARRILNFGRAVYPHRMRRNLKAWMLGVAVPFGFVTGPLARLLYRTREKETRKLAEPIAGTTSVGDRAATAT